MLALLFPGQGSQEVGMGRDAAAASPAARAVFDAADAALGFRLSELCFQGPEDELKRTEIQQPAILTTSVALLRMLEEEASVAPEFVAGHSLGEYTALVAAGALQFEDAVRLVHARGRFMQEAVPEGRGSMAAVIGLDAGDVAAACERAQSETGEVVAPANFNSPQQTVVAGTVAAVEAASEQAREAGARRVLPLPVSAPFHCQLMAPAAAKLAIELSRVSFAEARPPVVTNVEAEPNAAAARIPELLEAQVTAPVRFTEMIARALELGVERVLEIGPGAVLSGLVARIDRRLPRASLSSHEGLADAVAFLEAK
ncbi:MAG: ACP S-malonyltransferase [Proteobacteria bacterium]|nr:ACP S-malonyltransferase [Pseudomonadota bacterium]